MFTNLTGRDIYAGFLEHDIRVTNVTIRVGIWYHVLKSLSWLRILDLDLTGTLLPSCSQLSMHFGPPTDPIVLTESAGIRSN